MTTESEVRQFLNEFHQKLQVFEIIFRDERGKNKKTLIKLEIAPADRKKIIENLRMEDYCEGPLEDTLYKIGSLWVFGVEVKKEEIYIKISIGLPNYGVICISFHISERPLAYPFKKMKT